MTTAETPVAEWSFAKKFGFRFLFCYFVLYFFPFPLDSIPWTTKLWDLITAGFNRLTVWTGAHVLRLPQPITFQPTGSGDTTHDYVLLFITFVITLAAAVLWTALDRRRKTYAWLAGWFRVYLRYALAAIMLSYGISKVLHLQMPSPDPGRLTETYGASSPMGLAWTFMGYSAAYSFFAGALECLGGLLLLFRRTATLGAVVTAAVMANVVMMNFCFDIPVKLYSTHLLLTALVILGPAMGRMLGVFLLHRAVDPEDIRPPQWAGWRRWSRYSLKALIVGFVVLYPNLTNNWGMWKMMHAPKDPLEGTYEVESFRRGGAEVPALITDATRWRSVTVYRMAFVYRGMDDKGKGFPYQANTAKGTLDLFDFKTQGTEAGKVPQAIFQFKWTEPAHLLLLGTFEGTPLEVHLKKKDASDFPLMSRGFHWINELPYNR